MGNCFDTDYPVNRQQAGLAAFKAKAIGNNFETKEQLVQAIRDAGLEQFNLLIAIDFTHSNTWQGAKTFGGKSLHDLHVDTPVQSQYQPAKLVDPDDPPVYRQASIGRTLTFGKGMPNIQEMKEYMNTLNPYQYVMSVAGNQLNSFDDDGYIPTIIFGHARDSKDPYYKEISSSERGCYKIDDVIASYEKAVSTYGLSGPTKFAPIIEWGIQKVRSSNNSYHILLIIGDGVIDDYNNTVQALQQASKYPLSIVFCGVGDGSNPDHPADKWAKMRILDDAPTGDVDNWQSVYIANMQKQLAISHHPDLDLVTHMMMEIPEQYAYFKSKGMI